MPPPLELPPLLPEEFFVLADVVFAPPPLLAFPPVLAPLLPLMLPDELPEEP
jgi:hypothetical protein